MSLEKKYVFHWSGKLKPKQIFTTAASHKEYVIVAIVFNNTDSKRK